MKLDAIGLSSKDFKKTIEFYSMLGFEFGDLSEGDMHLETIPKTGEIRLMFDTVELLTKLNGVAPHPPTHSIVAVLCDSPEDVDRVADLVHEAGFSVIKRPWNAFWGQRYAVLQDPDGYLVDLFAPLEK